jgi:hypothetical protein
MRAQPTTDSGPDPGWSEAKIDPVVVIGVTDRGALSPIHTPMRVAKDTYRAEHYELINHSLRIGRRSPISPARRDRRTCGKGRRHHRGQPPRPQEYSATSTASGKGFIFIRPLVSQQKPVRPYCCQIHGYDCSPSSGAHKGRGQMISRMATSKNSDMREFVRVW